MRDDTPRGTTIVVSTLIRVPKTTSTPMTSPSHRISCKPRPPGRDAGRRRGGALAPSRRLFPVSAPRLAAANRPARQGAAFHPIREGPPVRVAYWWPPTKDDPTTHRPRRVDDVSLARVHRDPDPARG